MARILTGRVVLEQVAVGEPGASHGGAEGSHTENRLQVCSTNSRKYIYCSNAIKSLLNLDLSSKIECPCFFFRSNRDHRRSYDSVM